MSRVQLGLDPFPTKAQVEAKLAERLPKRPDVADMRTFVKDQVVPMAMRDVAHIRARARALLALEGATPWLDSRQLAPWLHVEIPFALLVPDNGCAKYGVLNGRMILTKRYRRAKKKIAELAQLQCAKWRPYSGPVDVSASLSFPPDKKRRDAPNYAKLVHDALKGICYDDDSQIEESHWRRVADSETPVLHLTVTSLRNRITRPLTTQEPEP